MNKGCNCESMGKPKSMETSEDERVGEITQELGELEEEVNVLNELLSEKLQLKLETVLSNPKENADAQGETSVEHSTELGDRIFLVRRRLTAQINFLKELISRIEL